MILMIVNYQVSKPHPQLKVLVVRLLIHNVESIQGGCCSRGGKHIAADFKKCKYMYKAANFKKEQI